MREAIRAGRSAPTELFAETLDMSRFPQTLLEPDLAELLRKKYRGLKVDVVVAAATIALDFALRHRDAIWPGATIVFHSVSDAELGARRLPPRTIGLPVRYDFGSTFDLALKLRPGTRRVAVVAGASESDRAMLAIARASLERFASRLEIQQLAGLTLADTLAAVRALPQDAVVLYVLMFRDGAGVPQVPRDVLERITEVSRAPVFGVFETFLGHGIAAGSIASYAAQGRRTGELVARLHPPAHRLLRNRTACQEVGQVEAGETVAVFQEPDGVGCRQLGGIGHLQRQGTGLRVAGFPKIHRKGVVQLDFFL